MSRSNTTSVARAFVPADWNVTHVSFPARKARAPTLAVAPPVDTGLRARRLRAINTGPLRRADTSPRCSALSMRMAVRWAQRNRTVVSSPSRMATALACGQAIPMIRAVVGTKQFLTPNTTIPFLTLAHTRRHTLPVDAISTQRSRTVIASEATIAKTLAGLHASSITRAVIRARRNTAEYARVPRIAATRTTFRANTTGLDAIERALIQTTGFASPTR